MTRVADRRRHAIQRELLLGPATVRDIARALRRPQLLIWSDLSQLEKDGLVVTVWIQRPGWPDGALIAAYRLPTITEQDHRQAEQAARAAENTAFEQWLRAALDAAANTIHIPGDPS